MLLKALLRSATFSAGWCVGKMTESGSVGCRRLLLGHLIMLLERRLLQTRMSFHVRDLHKAMVASMLLETLMLRR